MQKMAAPLLSVSWWDNVPEVEETFHNHKHTYAYGSVAAHVTVDPNTGHVELIDMLMVEDVGRIVNPMTLHGQAIGAMVQGARRGVSRTYDL